MSDALATVSVAEILAGKIAALKPGMLPATTTRKCEDLLIDVVGLCVTARHQDYVKSALAGWDDDGPCTVIGHARRLTAAGAALVERYRAIEADAAAAARAHIAAINRVRSEG